MFKKKGDKGKEAGAVKAGDAASAPAAAPAPQAAAPEALAPEMLADSGPSGAQGQIPEGATATAAQGKGGQPYKMNLVTDLLLPLALVVGCGGAFGLTLKQVQDRTGVYGVDPEREKLVIQDKSLVAPTLLSEVAQMEPMKLVAKGDNKEAIAAARALIAKKPEDVRALLCAGQVLIDAGSRAEREEGLELVGKAAGIATYSMLVQLDYARQLNALDKDDKAVEVYEKVCRLFADAGVVPHKELAELYMKTNRPTEAVTTLSKLLKDAPNDPSIQRQLGLAMAQDGKQQEGFEEFQKGFTKEQDNLGCPYAVKSVVDAHAGLIESALADTEKRVAKNPNDVKGMITLARLYIGANKLKEARDTLEKARKIQELNPDLHEVMAEVMVRQNQATSGFDEFRMAASNLHLRD